MVGTWRVPQKRVGGNKKKKVVVQMYYYISRVVQMYVYLLVDVVQIVFLAVHFDFTAEIPWHHWPKILRNCSFDSYAVFIPMF